MQWIRVILASAILMAFACGAPAQSTIKPDSPEPAKSMAGSTTLPAIVTLATSQGEVILPHLAHAKRHHCATCHSEIKPGQRAWDKDTVHAYCRACHETEGSGPTTCNTCHRK